MNSVSAQHIYMSVSTEYFVSDAEPWIPAPVQARTGPATMSCHTDKPLFICALPNAAVLTLDAALQEPSLAVVEVDVAAAACGVMVSSTTSSSPSVVRSGSIPLRTPRCWPCHSNGNILSSPVCMVCTRGGCARP